MNATSLQNVNIFPRRLAKRGTVALALAMVFAYAFAAAPAVQAQTFQVIHTFTGPDGAAPNNGLTIDAAGNLYGTATEGGSYGDNCVGSGGCGTVFRLNHAASGWVLTALYIFAGGNDAVGPLTKVMFGRDGTL
jgi:hypothetical protein